MLKLKRLAIDTYGENVAFLNRCCSDYRAEDFIALNKIDVKADGRHVIATLNIVDDAAIVPADSLGLSLDAFRRLGLPENTPVSVEQAMRPHSLEAIRAKIQGEILSAATLDAVVKDIADNRYSKMEIAAFLIACASFMSTEEVLDMTRAMARVGHCLTWDAPVIVDKHCIGGIPGNRTSMIVVPIVAAYGLPIPKTSSRAITSPAGTADTMEVLANVDIDVESMQAMVRETNGCLVWGGHVNLSPADDILISVERPLAIDTREQLVASILSKKLAAGSTHLVIDIPVGPSAKVRSSGEAARLRKLFEYVGDRIGLTLEVVMTDGRQPVGRGVGPVLEARDVLAVLHNRVEAPNDLRERAITLAGRIIEFDPAVRGGNGAKIARKILEDGGALGKFEEIVRKQGKATAEYSLGSLAHDVCATKSGVVEAIDCLRISRVARLAGAPMDKGAGVDIFKKIGDKARAGEPLYRIYADIEADFRFATEFAGAGSGYEIS